MLVAVLLCTWITIHARHIVLPALVLIGEQQQEAAAAAAHSYIPAIADASRSTSNADTNANNVSSALDVGVSLSQPMVSVGPAGKQRKGRSAAVGANMNSTSSTGMGVLHQGKRDDDFPSLFDDNNNSNSLVHVVITRFMQFQGQQNLTRLGLARVKLLEAITLQSLAAQTNKNFLWMILVDPQLDDVVRRSLFGALSTVNSSPGSSKLNVVVLATNAANLEMKFRSSTALVVAPVLFSCSSSGSGSGNSHLLLKMYHDAAQRRTVIETKLDADDALAIGYVESIQRDVRNKVAADYEERKSFGGQGASKIGCRFYCVDTAVEWKHGDIIGSGTAVNSNPGFLLVSGSRSNFCLTAGLSIAYAPNVTREEIKLSTFAHHDLHRNVPSCGDSSGNSSNACLKRVGSSINDHNKDAYSDHDGGRINDSGNTENNNYVVLRGRTLTSSGMKNVQVSGSEAEKWQHKQGELWPTVERRFGVRRKQIASMRDAIGMDARNILPEALRGLCTPGFSCKRDAQVALKTLLKKVKTNKQVKIGM